MGIDYGTKRTGIAVTDPLQLIASGLTTVPTNELWNWLKEYFEKEDVEKVILGEPLHSDGTPTKIHHLIVGLSNKIKKEYPQISTELRDERFSSQIAQSIILQSGAKKKKRQEKGLTDKVSATIILQDYMESEVW